MAMRRSTRLGIAALVMSLSGLTGCQTWTAGMTLPSGYYLRHTPQYFSPDPAFPLPRELASMEDPAGAAARAVGGFGAGPAPVAPTAPAPLLAPGPGMALPPQ